MAARADRFHACGRHRDDSGFMLMEVVVSALLVTLIASGALMGFQAATRAGAQERYRAQAHGLGQEDQARLRVMRLSDLTALNATTTKTISGNTYTINSTSQYVTDSTGTASCASGSASADYLRVTTEVTWPSIGTRPPVLLNSIVAPPNGAVSANSGALAISVLNAAGQGIGGFPLSGTGAGTFGGSTADNGCIIFGGLLAGNYTLTPGGGAGYVDPDGNPPSPKTTSVVAYSTNTVALQYDLPGSINTTFTTINNGLVTASTADSIVAFNSGMTTAKIYGTVGTRLVTQTAGPLFPFTSPITVYAGSCTGNNPNPTGVANPTAAAAMANVTLTPGGVAPASLKLPALDLTVKTGTSAGNPGLPLNNARVEVRSDDCFNANGTQVERTYTTNLLGKLPDPGLPYGTYDVCADNGTKRKTDTNEPVINPQTPRVTTIYLGSGTQNGTC